MFRDVSQVFEKWNVRGKRERERERVLWWDQHIFFIVFKSLILFDHCGCPNKEATVDSLTLPQPWT